MLSAPRDLDREEHLHEPWTADLVAAASAMARARVSMRGSTLRPARALSSERVRTRLCRGPARAAATRLALLADEERSFAGSQRVIEQDADSCGPFES